MVSQNLLILEKKSSPGSSTATKEDKTDSSTLKSRKLFEYLQRLMIDEQLFKDPTLTREAIINKLSTNATYLTKCIRENADMNYSQYVNSFRIAEAVRLLSSQEFMTIPIMSLAERSGFNSQTTFYKVFQQAMGVSPSAYRKECIVLEK